MPWDFLLGNILDGYLYPLLCPPVRVNLLQGLGLLFTNVHLDKQLPGWTSPRSLHLLHGQFPPATPVLSNHTVYWGVWGLEVILPHFIIIKGGPGYAPCRAARLGIGWDIYGRESLGMVFELGDKGSPQCHLGSVLGGEQQEYPLQSLQLSILEWCLELLLDLLLALGTFLWPLRAVPSLPSW